MDRRSEKALPMPLATGATAFTSETESLAVFPLFVATAFMAVALTVSGHWLVALFPAAFVVALSSALVDVLRDVRKRRASDIVLDDSGFTVRGGPHDGYHAEWAALTPAAFVVQQTKDFKESKSGDRTYLVRFLVSQVPLAESYDPAEIGSFHALRDAMCHRATRIDDTTTATELPPPTVAIESCSQCGAPLVPSDQDEILCERCGANNAVPLALRQSIRGAAEADLARQELANAVGGALSQGQAAAVNYALVAFWIVALAALVAAVIAVSLASAAWLFVPAVASVLCSAAVVRIQVARRCAVQGLTSGCAAYAPRHPGEPPTCRCCLGPLPSSGAPTRVFATCVYCGTTNVLGISRSFVGESLVQSFEVEEVMGRRKRDITRWIAVCGGAAATVLASAVLHVVG